MLYLIEIRKSFNGEFVKRQWVRANSKYQAHEKSLYSLPKCEQSFIKSTCLEKTGEKIGLSLSFCIRDILDGKVKIEDVHKIITNTKVEDNPQWDNVIKRYGEYYWNGRYSEAQAIIDQLLKEDRIFQPRVDMGIYVKFHKDTGYWGDIFSEFKLFNADENLDIPLSFNKETLEIETQEPRPAE